VVGRGAVASHYSYYTQRSGLGTQTDVLRQYRDIAMSVCGELVRQTHVIVLTSNESSTGLSPHRKLNYPCVNRSQPDHIHQIDLKKCHGGFEAAKVLSTVTDAAGD